MRLPAFTIALALICVAPCASAQLYKWVDADGVINYGDWPPPGVKIQAVTHGTVSVVTGGSRAQASETRARSARSEERRNQRDAPDADAAPTQVAMDDAQYADAYAADYGYPARRVRRAEAALDRPRPEPRIAQPGPAVDLPSVPDMPRLPGAKTRPRPDLRRGCGAPSAAPSV
jgi:Domain of unknown function (DUF4124)